MIGESTSTYHTRHDESWWDKLCELGRYGYIPVELAGRSVVPDEWSPPKLTEREAFVLDRIRRGES